LLLNPQAEAVHLVVHLEAVHLVVDQVDQVMTLLLYSSKLDMLLFCYQSWPPSKLCSTKFEDA